MIVEVDKLAIEIDVVIPDAVVVDASAVLPIQVISKEEIPDVSPLQIVDYGSSSIECAFDVSTEQAEEVVRGVLCGTINPPTFENADYRLLYGQGSMDLAFAGLQANIEYYLRPYALSNLGYKYGDVVAQRTKANPIPDEYQLVEYLESRGTQYIQVNGNINNDYGYEAEYSIGQYRDKYPCGLVGGTGRLFGWGSISETQLTYGWGSLTTAYSNGLETVTSSFWSLDNYGIYSLNYLNLKKAVRRGVQFDISNSGDMFTSSGITIFGSSVSKIACRIKWWKISHNTEVAYSLYPVYRKSDNKPGMYDIVNNQFYTNQGSGEFEVGPDKEWEE